MLKIAADAKYKRLRRKQKNFRRIELPVELTKILKSVNSLALMLSRNWIPVELMRFILTSRNVLTILIGNAFFLSNKTHCQHTILRRSLFLRKNAYKSHSSAYELIYFLHIWINFLEKHIMQSKTKKNRLHSFDTEQRSGQVDSEIWVKSEGKFSNCSFLK